MEGTISDEEKLKFNELETYFENIKFYEIFVDSRFEQFVKLTSEHEKFSNRDYSDEEKDNLDKIAKEVLESILNSDEK